jgi:ribokinase
VKLAVVGHVEWVDFVVVPRLPAPGEIASATMFHEGPAGGGAMAAYAMRSLAGACTFYTAVGDDLRAQRTVTGLSDAGLDLRASVRSGRAQRRALTWLTGDGERTITVLGPPLEPSGDDELPWDELAAFDAALVVTGDAAAIRAARAARVLVATPRARAGLFEAGVRVDALVGSAADRTDVIDEALLAAARPRVVVETEGASGGSWREADGTTGRWQPEPPPRPPIDAFGCGDAFAAALTAGLAAGRSVTGACSLAACAGATVLAQRAPSVGDLSRCW